MVRRLLSPVLVCALLLLALPGISFGYHTGSRLHGRAYNRSPFQRIEAGWVTSFEIRGGAIWGRGSVGTLGLNSPVDTFGQVGIDTRWVNVSSGLTHTIGLKSDGTLWGWGDNSLGQLANTGASFYDYPVQIGSDNKWAAAAVGDQSSAGIKSDGTLWTWGENNVGQLGQGFTSFYQAIPTQIGTDNKWVAVVAASQHMLALKSDGTLWTWGNGTFGQLGNGNNTSSSVPVQVGSATNWISISAGINYNMAIKADGTLWGWGANGAGQLGIFNNIGQNVPVQVGSDNSWTEVSAGRITTIAIKANGTLWSWGNNSFGQLGDNSGFNGRNYPAQVGTDNKWTAVSTGYWHALAIKSNGEQWGWGQNSDGCVSTTGFDGIIATPVLVDTLNNQWNTVAQGQWHTMAIRSNGTLWGWGYNDFGVLGIGSSSLMQSAPVPIGTDNKWIQLACGKAHSLGLKSDGTIWGWGSNGYNAVGTGTNTSYFTPVQIGTDNTWTAVIAGDEYSAGLKANGTLWAWGGGYGTTPTQVGTSTLWTNISCGVFHAVAMRCNGTLWSVAASGTTQIGTDNKWIRAVAGGFHTMGIKSNGTLHTWGDNIYGQLGNGNTVAQTSPVQISSDVDWKEIAAGHRHSFALKNYGTLFSFGYNASGQLALNNYLSVSNPQPNAGVITAVQLWTGSSSFHSSVIQAARQTLCLAGYNLYGQLGDGTTTDKSVFTCISSAILNPIIPSITVAANPGNTVCAGISVTFTATISNGGTAPAYQWKVNGLNVGTNSATYTTSTLATGDVVTCTLTSNAPGATTTTVTSTAITMTVNSNIAPTLTIATPQNPVCLGASVTFTATAANAGATPSYQWKLNGVNTGTNAATYTTTTLATGDVVSCTLSTINPCGGGTIVINSNAIAVLVSPTPSVSITASATILCSSTVDTFNATALYGGTAPVYQWKKNGVNVGSNSPQYVATGFQTGDVVAVQMTSSLPCVSQPTVQSNSVTLTVQPSIIPGININSNQPLQICTGVPVTFTSNIVEGGASPSYQWRKNGLTVGGNTASYTDAGLINGDTIVCRLTSSSACPAEANVLSNKLSHTVLPMVAPAAVITASPGTTFTTGQSITFSSTIANGGSNPVYQWLRNGFAISLANSASYTTNTMQDGDIFSLKITSNAPCVTTLNGISNELTVHTATGIGAAGTWDGTLRLFPNPTSGSFTVEGSWNQKSGTPLELTVINALGQTVLKQSVIPAARYWTIPVHLHEGLANGVYLLRLTSSQRQSSLSFHLNR